jgi:CubicO group peptidase (beta-lactamase class C family)
MEGVLPVSVSNFAEGLGKKIKENTIDPNIYEKVGMDKKYFDLIDSIAQEGVDVLAYPGCRILVAKDGYTVYNKAFGYQTYDTMASRVELSTMYDIASVTKIVATTLAVMKLVDDGLVSIDDPLVDYLPYLKRTNKKNITIKQALSHYAQLQAFVPYWKDAVKSDAVLRITDNSENVDTTEYSIVSPNFYVEKDYRERILKKIADTKLLKEKKYVYSDFGFIFLGDLVERVSGQPLDEYVEQNFYIPMGLKHIAFKPLEKGFTTDEIAPTENDKHFRHTLVQGYVHDENSALLGGVAGHAGLFATANDLAAVLQMLIDGGTYKGTEYLSKEVIKLFNTRHYAKDGNRRALGFDKPFINDASTHVSPRASQSSFGHTGFTGTMVWADPDHGLVYIFLSNRVHPTPANSKLSKMNIRTNIQDLIYKSIKTK